MSTTEGKTMNKRDRFREYINDLTPFTEMCTNCVFFVRHYIQYSVDRYVAIEDGHCRHGRLKVRKTYDVCDDFVNRFYDDCEWL